MDWGSKKGWDNCYERRWLVTEIDELSGETRFVEALGRIMFWVNFFKASLGINCIRFMLDCLYILYSASFLCLKKWLHVNRGHSQMHHRWSFDIVEKPQQYQFQIKTINAVQCLWLCLKWKVGEFLWTGFNSTLALCIVLLLCLSCLVQLDQVTHRLWMNYYKILYTFPSSFCGWLSNCPLKMLLSSSMKLKCIILMLLKKQLVLVLQAWFFLLMRSICVVVNILQYALCILYEIW